MVKTTGLEDYSDDHQTPLPLARLVIDHFNPTGAILEPFRGRGAFYRALPPGTRWCEVTEGRDFFDWPYQVDWIVTNPPYSNLTEVMAHCFEVASHTVLLVPMSKVYSSAPRMELVRTMAGIQEQLYLGPGRRIGFDLGFPFAAIKFTRGWRGPTKTVWVG